MTAKTIRILNPDDQAALEAFLCPRVASSMFLLSNMRTAGLRESGQPYTGTYAAVFDDTEIIGVVAHFWNHNLILQAPLLAPELCRAAVAASHRPLKGLIGPDDQVQRVLSSIPIDPNSLQLDETEKLYVLPLDSLINPVLRATGPVQARQVTADDLDLITQWRVAYTIEALGYVDGPQLREQSRSECERSVRQGTMWVLEDAGVPVACTGFNAMIAEAVQVGGVWTPPMLRGRGYARTIVAGSLAWAQAAGKTTAILFTGEQNLPAQRAYEALGFQHIGGYRIVLFQSSLDL